MGGVSGAKFSVEGGGVSTGEDKVLNLSLRLVQTMQPSSADGKQGNRGVPRKGYRLVQRKVQEYQI